MAKNKKGLFARIIEGPERSEDYARKTMPTNRWSLGWDLLVTNFGKIVKINLLTFIFVIPIVLVLFLRQMLISGQSTLYPFSQNTSMVYPAYPFLSGVAESITLQTDFISFVIVLVFSLIAAVGLSGGFYVMRNLVWTEGVFVASDFWTGVKKNYKVVLPATLVYVLALALSVLSIDLAEMLIASGAGKEWLFVVSKIISYIFIVFFTSTYLFMLSMGVTYELKFFQSLRNAFILTVGLLPLNVFYMIFGALPVIFLLFGMQNFLFMIGIIVFIFLSIALFMLVWTNYSQWAFDEFVNDKVAGAKKYRGINKKQVQQENEEFVYKKSALTIRPVKPITDYDVEIAALPESYSRKDLERLAESKKKMIEDSDRYAEEHKDDYLKAQADIDEFMSDKNASDATAAPSDAENTEKTDDKEKAGK